MKIECPRCGQHYKLGEEFAGKEVECTACTLKFTVPKQPAPNPTAPAKTSADGDLGSCPTCGGKLAKSALVCPHCGARKPQPEFTGYDIFVLMTSIIFFALTALMIVNSGRFDILGVVSTLAIMAAIYLRRR